MRARVEGTQWLAPHMVRVVFGGLDLAGFPAPEFTDAYGEAGEVREIRRHLLGDRHVPRAALSASGYWRRNMTDETWRTVKAAWSAEVERDVPMLVPSGAAS